MKQALHTLQVGTGGQGLHDITRPIRNWVDSRVSGWDC